MMLWRIATTVQRPDGVNSIAVTAYTGRKAKAIARERISEELRDPRSMFFLDPEHSYWEEPFIYVPSEVICVDYGCDP